MKNTNIVVVNFPYSSYEEFEQRQKELIKDTLVQIINQPGNSLPENLSRQQACDYLNISLSTLNTYTKEGFLKKYRFGGNRVLYKRSELDEALTSIETLPKKLKRRK